MCGIIPGSAVQQTTKRLILNPARCPSQAVSDDISYIESQNRGLQVQTSNQKALLAELENLLVRFTVLHVMSTSRLILLSELAVGQTIVQVDNEDLMTLTQESPGSDKGIVALESAAASLYKALQAIKETCLFPACICRHPTDC